MESGGFLSANFWAIGNPPLTYTGGDFARRGLVGGRARTHLAAVVLAPREHLQNNRRSITVGNFEAKRIQTTIQASSNLFKCIVTRHLFTNTDFFPAFYE